VIIRVRIRRVSTDARLGVDASAINQEIRREFGTSREVTADNVKQRFERALARTVDPRRVG